MNNKLLFLLISLFLLIKSEHWYNEIKGSNKNDGKNGYAGKRGDSITGFYLCGTRSYRVHFLGDEDTLWSKEYTSCDPVGIGRPIDGISISGGKGYMVRLTNGNWLGMVYKFNIKDLNNGMAGILGNEIDSVLIKGGDKYRVCTGGYSSSPEEVASRVIKSWFGLSVSFMFAYKIDLIDDAKLKVTGEIIGNANINYDGKIKMIVENNKIKDFSCGGILSSKVNELIETILGDSFKAFENWSLSFSNEMENGQVTVDINFLTKKVVFEAATKITKDHGSFRGGFRIIFQVKDDPTYLKPSKVAVRSFEPYVEKERKKTFLKNFNNFRT